MKTKLLLVKSFITCAALVSAQTTLSVKVNAALDDHEERTTGPVVQGGTVGSMYPGSTSLELGYETGTADPVLTGLRFANVSIPKFATIINAYIQFTVKGTAKNSDPCNLTVRSESSANAATFSDNANSLSGRTLNSGSIAWNVAGTWGTVDAAGIDQRTPEIKSLVQPIVFNNSWVSGNAMAFYIKGIGAREVYSFEGDPTKTAELVITYSTTGGTPNGIEELSQETTASVYPNPFKNSFSLNVEVKNSSDIKISVHDLTGKMMEEKIVKDPAAGLFHYTSTSALVPGMYFVKVQANGKEDILKLISE